MRAATAIAVSLALLTGCFPHNERYRTYAKLGEGASLLTGVVMEGIIESGADCDAMQKVPGVNDSANQSCHTSASALSTVGLVLILGGILGFVATVSTSPDDNAPKPIVIKEDNGAAKPTPVTSTNIPVVPAAAGSAVAPKSAP